MKIQFNQSEDGEHTRPGCGGTRLAFRARRATWFRNFKAFRAAPRRRESGMATVLFIALLAIMMVLVMVEAKSLVRLHREVKLLEQQQIKRLDNPQAGPGSPSTHP